MRGSLDLKANSVSARPAAAPLRAADQRPGADSSVRLTNSEQKLGVTARSFSILGHVAAAQGPVDVADIIGSLKLPKATAYRLVDWFVGRGYLAREPARKRLIVGPKLTNLAFSVLAASMRNDAPHLVLQRLTRDLAETCNIGTLLNGEVVYLDRVEAEHWPLRLNYKIGSRVPLHCTAIGKLLLALAPAPRRQRLLQSVELHRFTDNTIRERGRLERELKQIRRDQASFDREEYLAGVVCIAVPIIGGNGETLAGLAVQAPEARMDVRTARGHLPALRRAAKELAKIYQDGT